MCCFIFLNGSFAQKPEFYLAPYAGLLNGKKHASQMPGLTAGVANKQWVYGIGSSVDYYKLRSVPVYAEVKRSLGNKTNTPFLYANAGININWVLESQHPYHNNWGWGTTPTTCNFSNGHFVEAGTGVNIKNKKGKGLFLSLGYSRKSLSEAWKESTWDPLKNEIVMTDRSKKYLLNRLVFKVGFRLF
jgi:hypothetical protein